MDELDDLEEADTGADGDGFQIDPGAERCP